MVDDKSSNEDQTQQTDQGMSESLMMEERNSEASDADGWSADELSLEDEAESTSKIEDTELPQPVQSAVITECAELKSIPAASNSQVEAMDIDPSPVVQSLDVLVKTVNMVLKDNHNDPSGGSLENTVSMGKDGPEATDNNVEVKSGVASHQSNLAEDHVSDNEAAASGESECGWSEGELSLDMSDDENVPTENVPTEPNLLDDLETKVEEEKPIIEDTHESTLPETELNVNLAPSNTHQLSDTEAVAGGESDGGWSEGESLDLPDDEMEPNEPNVLDQPDTNVEEIKPNIENVDHQSKQTEPELTDNVPASHNDQVSDNEASGESERGWSEGDLSLDTSDIEMEPNESQVLDELDNKTEPTIEHADHQSNLAETQEHDKVSESEAVASGESESGWSADELSLDGLSDEEGLADDPDIAIEPVKPDLLSDDQVLNLCGRVETITDVKILKKVVHKMMQTNHANLSVGIQRLRELGDYNTAARVVLQIRNTHPSLFTLSGLSAAFAWNQDF